VKRWAAHVGSENLWAPVSVGKNYRQRWSAQVLGRGLDARWPSANCEWAVLLIWPSPKRFILLFHLFKYFQKIHNMKLVLSKLQKFPNLAR
jgi:hypothetical protein